MAVNLVGTDVANRANEAILHEVFAIRRRTSAAKSRERSHRRRGEQESVKMQNKASGNIGNL
jgi:hypothetical protein